MKILSIRAPWWWWIIYGGKDIENRDWRTDYRGPVLIHASSWWSLQGVADDAKSAQIMRRATGLAPRNEGAIPAIPAITHRAMRDLGGHIVGQADIVGCVTESKSPWFCGKYGFVLANAKPVEPIKLKSRLGLYSAPPEIIAALKPTTTEAGR